MPHCTSSGVPFSSPLISESFAESSSLRKSFVFCARSFRCTKESRWCATISEAVVSRDDTRVVRLIAVSKVNDNFMNKIFAITNFSKLLLLSEIYCFHLDRWFVEIRPSPQERFCLTPLMKHVQQLQQCRPSLLSLNDQIISLKPRCSRNRPSAHG